MIQGYVKNRIHKLWHVYKMEYHATEKMNELLNLQTFLLLSNLLTENVRRLCIIIGFSLYKATLNLYHSY